MSCRPAVRAIAYAPLPSEFENNENPPERLDQEIHSALRQAPSGTHMEKRGREVVAFHYCAAWNAHHRPKISWLRSEAHVRKAKIRGRLPLRSKSSHKGGRMLPLQLSLFDGLPLALPPKARICPLAGPIRWTGAQK